MPPQNTDPSAKPGRRPSQAHLILEAARAAGPFCSELGQPFVCLPLPTGAQEIVPLYSVTFRNWIIHSYYSQYETPPSRWALDDALATLRALAACVGPVTPVSTRISAADGRIYLDLAGPSKHIVEIDQRGWRIRTDVPHRFRHNRNARELPDPVEPSTPDPLQQLRSLLNIRSTPAWNAILGWLIAALRPSGPYPTLFLLGAPASGKSTLLRILRSLVDPGAAPSCPHPARLSELAALAAAHWVLAFDHIEKLPAPIAAALARLATSESILVRDRLHDAEGFHAHYQRPILLSGVEPLAVNSSFKDRCIVTALETIDPAQRRSEEEIFATVDALRPSLLGALCSAVSTALANWPTTHVSPGTRFADTARWIAAAAPALGLPEEPLTQLSHPAPKSVATCLQALLADQTAWTGTASTLLETLRASQPDYPWPATPRALSQFLSRTHIPGLRFETSRTNSRRVIRLTKFGDAKRISGPLYGNRLVA